MLRNRQTVGFRGHYLTGSVSHAARRADFAVVASGTATLQVAAVGCPMVVMYQSSKIMWHLLGKWLVKTKHLSLVNILAEKQLVPEFMPYFKSIDPIVVAVELLLDDKNRLSQTSSDLIDLASPLHAGVACEKAAGIAVKMLTP